MKRIASILFAFSFITLLAGAASAHPCTPRIDRREARQQFRIRQGVRQGQITPLEARRLRMGERRIQHMERLARADGHVRLRERVRIHRALTRQSRRIFWARHNGRMV